MPPLDAPAQVAAWLASGRYVGGRDLAHAGLAKLVPLQPLALPAALH